MTQAAGRDAEAGDEPVRESTRWSVVDLGHDRLLLTEPVDEV